MSKNTEKPINVSDDKNVTISFRCTEEEQQRIQEYASKNKQTISEYLRDTKIPEKKDLDELKNQIRRNHVLKVEFSQMINDTVNILENNPCDDPEVIRNIIDSLKKKGEEIWL